MDESCFGTEVSIFLLTADKGRLQRIRYMREALGIEKRLYDARLEKQSVKKSLVKAESTLDQILARFPKRQWMKLLMNLFRTIISHLKHLLLDEGFFAYILRAPTVVKEAWQAQFRESDSEKQSREVLEQERQKAERHFNKVEQIMRAVKEKIESIESEKVVLGRLPVNRRWDRSTSKVLPWDPSNSNSLLTKLKDQEAIEVSLLESKRDRSKEQRSKWWKEHASLLESFHDKYGQDERHIRQTRGMGNKRTPEVCSSCVRYPCTCPPLCSRCFQDESTCSCRDDEEMHCCIDNGNCGDSYCDYDSD
eukprot:TRINITY_DN82229_c0_g1_i1.p1 TRINITY_DN82229_c0_g1~~TRINITY_DN82229_c0_g1_i1.p1  ORF type:complete len:307 (-),score=30.83 TRINITY_DN82229_c0_g1_i1:116-1036(-)